MLYQKITSYQGKKYLYLLGTNSFIGVSEPLFAMIDDLVSLAKPILFNKYASRYENQLINECLGTVDQLKELGLFQEMTGEKCDYKWDEGALVNLLSTKMNSITLGVTEACNLRCKYCLYSGAFPNQRTHNSKNMSLATARQAVEYLLAHSQEQTQPRVVSFYGGEPLLRWPLIKTIISQYGSQNNTLQYSLTTNGTFLDRAKTEFLIEHNVTLIVSLDGPEMRHDRNRIFAHNQKGSFQLVWKNLQTIREISAEYYHSFLICNAVLTNPVDFKELNSFFAANQLTCMTRWVETYGASFRQNSRGAKGTGWEEMKQVFYEEAVAGNIAALDEENEHRFIINLFKANMKKLHYREVRLAGEAELVNRMICIPGARKLFVDTEGRLFPCEKLDGSKNMQLGTLEKGIDMAKIRQIMNKFRTIQMEDCYDCWLIRICDLCYLHVTHHNQMDLAKKRFNCQVAKSYYHELLQLYVSILEKNINAFDKF